MSSEPIRSRRLRFDTSHPTSTAEFPISPAIQTELADLTADPRVASAIARTRDYLIASQAEDGHWRGELEGDTILESEYILLLTFLGQGHSSRAVQAANYIRAHQLPEGGWAIYPGGPLEISASVKSYFALKIVGDDPDAAHMRRAKRAILEAGGVEAVNSFTRFYLALLGVISYQQCPAVPPELVLLPSWMPFNIYEMSAWSRTILVPLSILWAHRPVSQLPPEQNIRELFLRTPEELSSRMETSAVVDKMSRGTWLNWDEIFRRLDQALKLADRLRIRPLRRVAVRKAAEWMLDRFQESDGLGAIFPPIVWSVVALKCLGYDDDSPEVRSQLQELENLVIEEGDQVRLEPCKSPVWDTALTTIALRDSGLAWNHPTIRRSVEWLLSKEVREPGDWTHSHRDTEPGGWFFEYRNRFYPDVDDTTMVVMALGRCLPESSRGLWTADFFLEQWSPHEADRNTAAIISSRSESAQTAVREVEAAWPILAAMWRGTRWVRRMQCRNGGWGAFDSDNTRELFTRVPFADHNAMIDPPTADITARVLEMFAAVHVPQQHPSIQRALNFVWDHQETDGCWYGRWGVNYIYGTWQAIVGMTAMGVPVSDPRIQRGAEWLKSVQQPSGGWGETPRSYDDPTLRGQGPETASQTAWALLGLIAAGQTDSDAVHRGIQYLMETQQPDGTWDEPWFTGTGFPRVFYLRYHMYRLYFPLMALSRFEQHRNASFPG